MRPCVVIPAYNEGAMVAAVVHATRTAQPDATIVVVDDGSRDDTAARAAAAGAAVLSLPVNLGIGGAVQAGYRYALRAGCDVAVQVDGDGQHDPAEIDRLLRPLVAGQADLVVGSRWLGRGSYAAAPDRRAGMRVLARLVAWRSGQRLSDTTSGFRAAGPRALALFAEEYPTDYPEVETLVLAARRGLRVREVPVQMRPRSSGRSSIDGLRSAYYMARVASVLVLGATGAEPALVGVSR
ncbi:MAG: glycosyltransferase family 2 protein [Acidimicrobiales bacterium]